MELFPSVG